MMSLGWIDEVESMRRTTTMKTKPTHSSFRKGIGPFGAGTNWLSK